MDGALSRRDFLGRTAAGLGALAIGPVRAQPSVVSRADGCLFLHLVGGPPHLDTFDPKPAAPSDYRGPFGTIRTRVPGVLLSELFPRLAERTDRVAFIRSLHHDGPPVHECGFQMLHTGRLFRDGPVWPALGAVWSYLAGQMRLGPGHAYAVLPYPEVQTGIAVEKGFGPGFLAPPLHPQTVTVGLREQKTYDPGYGPGALGQYCQQAVRWLVRRPCSFITVLDYPTVFDALSWDCHGVEGALRTNLQDIGRYVAPAFDTAFAALLDELQAHGLLERILVVATGEFGRTPRVNPHGGRDHWAGVWTALVAGAGIRGGAVIGRSDAHGIEPADRPVTPAELAATILYALGVPLTATIPGPDGQPTPVYPARPLFELWT
ncbi:MAG: DUF1501 domain-containing protein [Gemmataceae bacterium]|nr:DUF1501 domain-containing protein [Gemmataceae bacterium]MCS7271092.1 DUF1501 domain-containing protein [Gemmataceae bacterium]MDW8244055.1 DUF1501 domain-containing protein [Thermogemmata sp.]